MEIPSDLVGRRQFDVSGYAVEVDLTTESLRAVYLPLLQSMIDSSGDTRRLFVGLSGIPGSGKSTFAAALRHVADRVPEVGRLVVVGMDGWHWPNAELAHRTTTDETGNLVPLRRRKGSPVSFDVASLIAAMDALAEADRDVLLPIYDRRLHEPIADGLIVPAAAQIILFEGNYLFLKDSPWDQVSSRLAVKLFLDCDRTIARRRVVERHVRGGLTQTEAMNKYETNDRLNTDTVLAASDCADLRIQLEPEPRLILSGQV